MRTPGTGRLTRSAVALLVAASTGLGTTAPAWAVEVTPSQRAVAEAPANPTTPTGLKVEPGATKLYVSWSANTDGALSYNVELIGGSVVSVPSGTQTATFSGLTNGTSYSVRINAQYANGVVSAWSSTVSGTPTAASTKPAQPVGLTASREDSKVTLTWSPGPADTRSKYVIRRNGTVVQDNYSATATSWVDTNVVNYTSYTYTITAVRSPVILNLADEPSDPSAPAVGTPVDLTAPAAPRNLAAANALDRQVALTWTANTEVDLKGYLVKAGDTVYASPAKGTQSVTVTGLTDGQAYTFAVYAVDTHDNVSLASASVLVTTLDRTPPDTPTNLAVNRADAALDLTWTAPVADDVAMYRIYLNGATTATATVNAPTTSRRVSGLVNGTAYTVRISAVDRAGNESTLSGPVSGTPRDLTPPAAPTGVVGTAGDSRATLTWNANSESDLDHYVVLNSAGTIVTTLGRGTTTASLTALVNGTPYSYSIAAVDTAGNTSTASAVVVVTPVDRTPPAVPTGLSAVPGDTTAVLTWNPVADADLDHYVLMDAGGAVVATVPKGTTTRTVTGLTNGSTYAYRIVSVDLVGNVSTPSSSVSVTPQDRTPPATPLGVTGLAGDTTATVSWNEVADGDLLQYVVLGPTGTVLRTVPRGTTTAQFTGLTNGTAYPYRVAAVDNAGNTSTPSATVTVTPRDSTPPAAPTGVYATAGVGSVTVGWTLGTEPDLAGYRVLDAVGATVATVTAPARTAVVTGLVSGTTYTYRVVALDRTGNVSDASAPVTATPADTTPPAVPTGVAADAGDGRVTVRWTGNTEADLDHYNVYDGTGAKVASVAKGATTSTITGLVNDTTYRYRVSAVDTAGNESSPSADVSVTPVDSTAPDTPRGFAAVAGDGGATLSWTASTEPDLDRYVVLDGAGVVVETITAPATTVRVGPLVNGTTYTYRLAAVDRRGNTSTSSAPVMVVPTDQTAPTTPTGVTAAAGDTTATVSWTAVTDADLHHYVVQDDTGRVLRTVPAGTTTTTFTSLTNAVAYSYRVVAVDATGNSSTPSAVVTATPQDRTAPAVPTGLTATAGDTTALLTWNAVADADVAGYVVHDAAGNVVATSVGTSTHVWVTSLVNGTSYSFTVSAVDRAENSSARSTPVTVSPRDTTAPGAPTAVIAAAGDAQATIAWTGSPDADVDHYDVLDADGLTRARVTATARTAVVANLVNGTPYEFSVQAVDASGNRSPLAAADPVTPVDRTPPAVPGKVTATSGDAQVTVSWDAVLDADLDHYVVVDGAGNPVASVARGTTSTVVTGLVNGTAYAYRVSAVDLRGNASALSAAAGATPGDLTPPAVPSGLTALAGDTTATVSFNPVADADVDRYVVVDGSGTVLATVVAPATTATLTGLTNGRAYELRVAAVDRTGNRSASSAPTTVTPADQTPPAAPTDLRASPGDRSALLTWGPVTDADLDHYEVRDQQGTLVASPARGTSFVRLTGLVNGSSYAYTLTAVDTSGIASAAVGPVSVVPGDDAAPPVVAGVGATAGDSEITVTWSASSDPDVDHYEITDQSGLTRAIARADATSAVVRGLVNGQAYTFTVRAVDAAGNRSPAVSTPPATPTDQTPTSTPAGFTATPGDGSVTLSWTPVGDADLARYVVRDDAGNVVATLDGSATSTTITGLANGQAVTYRIVAVDAAGNVSVPSGPVTATPRAADLTAPADFDGTSQDGAVALSWSAVPGAAGYDVTTGTTTTRVPGTSTTLTGLLNGTAYGFTVRAVSADGRPGLPSAAVVVTPRAPAAAPSAGGSGGGSGAAVTRSGRFSVVGTADALEAADTNGTYDLYVRDAKSGAVSRLAPGAGDARSSQLAMSEDGRYVALTTSTPLVAGDTNSLKDVYRVDRSTGTWTLVSAPPAGGASATVAGTEVPAGPNVYSGPSVAMSADGRYVFFFSKRADLLAPGLDKPDTVDLFRKDVVSGEVVRVSATSGSSQLTSEVLAPALAVTPDGRYAVFVVRASNTYPVVVRKDLQSGKLELASGTGDYSTQGAQYPVSYDAHDVSISDDGRYVGFSTNSSTLNPDAKYTAIRRDMTGTTTAAFTRAGSTVQRVIVTERQTTLDPTGRYVFFQTTGRELPLDGDALLDWYRYDTVQKSLVMVTTTASGGRPASPYGTTADADWGSLQVLDAGTVLVTTLQPLVPADTNKKADTYRKDLVTGAVTPALG
ncbi:fibronectin type III domain-containing protein [Kineococcus rubinsiae]|uniref:fibronectin type III domain-containing protein n=1 Tax=Kineococcus rubinsiae TaxID=2609562 RepID=UPI001431B424|nr:fibronectin type III domain-containing protein [Kineococcus rubinsiae]NIZ93486.1 hypothetical protein [Kineococcus rubinsiae]